jgi:DNA mismatch repair ATPase MutS
MKKTPASSGPAKGQKSIASFFSRVPQKPKPPADGERPGGADGDAAATPAPPPPVAATPPASGAAAAVAEGNTPPATAAAAATTAAAANAAAVQLTPVRSNDTAAPDQKTAAAAAAPAPAAVRRAPPAAARAPARATATAPPTSGLIGARIKVWWPAEGEWFKGTVEARDAATGRYRVAYDDGDVEALELGGDARGEGDEGGEGGERWERLSAGEESEDEQEEGLAKKSPPAGRRRAVLQDSDDDDDDDEAEAAAAARRCAQAPPPAKKQGAAAAAASPAAASGRGRRAAAAAAARKLAPAKRAKGSSEEEDDDDDDDDDDDSGSGSSDYKAGGAGASTEEDEEDDGDASAEDDDDDYGAAGGKKRRHGTNKGNKGAPASKKGKKAAASASEDGGQEDEERAANAANAAAITTPLAAGATPASSFGFRGAAPPSTGGGAGTMPPPARRPSLAAAGNATPRTPATGADAKNATTSHHDLVLGVATPATAAAAAASAAPDAARFAARMAERFPFLHPNRIRDARGRKPGEPGYDRRTLLVPSSWFREMKVTEAQQQWWRFKAAHFDSVLLFKVGKFYEMYEMDAYVGSEALGLSFMKGDQPHVGFPEAAYHGMAEGLARQGYRVVVVEQTETPDALRARNEQRKKRGQKAAGVVEREAVAVLTRGTLADAEMVDKAPDAAYALAVAELPPPPPAAGSSGVGATPAAAKSAGGVVFAPADPAEENDAALSTVSPPPPVVTLGACAVDVASSRVLVGGWPDGEVRLTLRSALTVLRPVELVLPAAGAGGGGWGAGAAAAAGAASSAAAAAADPGLALSTARLMRTALRAPPCNELLPRRPPGAAGGGRVGGALSSSPPSAAAAVPAGASPAPVGARTADAALAAASADDLCSPAEAWGHEAAAASLKRYFPRDGMPPLVAALCRVAGVGTGAAAAAEAADAAAAVLSARAALAALALAAQFLREALLDASTLPLARFELLPEAAVGPLGAALRSVVAAQGTAAAAGDGDDDTAAAAAAAAAADPLAALAGPAAGVTPSRPLLHAADPSNTPPAAAAAKSRRLALAADALCAHGGTLGMRLDGAALEGLEVLENAKGGTAGTLLGLLDHCATPFGRRRLRAWLSRPLYRASDVALRQDAVGELMGVAVPPEREEDGEQEGGGGDADDWGSDNDPAQAVAEAAADARRALAGVADVERAVARLVASAGVMPGEEEDGGEEGGGEGGNGAAAGGHGRDAAHVVLYEDVEKRRVKALLSALRDLQRVRRALQAVADAKPRSLLLRALSDPARWRRADALLEELLGAADWDEASASGRVLPRRAGAAPAVDAADARLADCEADLCAYLKEQRAKYFRNSSGVTYCALHKDPYVIEVPDALAGGGGGGGSGGGGGVPRSYELVGQRKGFKRYTTTQLRELVSALQEAQDARERALGGVLRALTRRFARGRRLWLAAADAAAALDALAALAGAATAAGGGVEGGVCRPRVVEPGTPEYWQAVEEARQAVRQAGGGAGGGGDASAANTNDASSSAPPLFHAVALRHPAGLGGREGGAFVPNDVLLGGGPGVAPPLAVLTGPNMGGKSTLLRQVCLAAVLAQCGAWVPARALSLTPADAVHVRMGARDHILAGQSTFFVELAETAAMLATATRRSLAALDELGRGTATQDGAAVAAAVLEHLAARVGCLGLFATHYHQLGCSGSGGGGGGGSAAATMMGGRVAPMHMACALRRRGGGGGAGGGGAAAVAAAAAGAGGVSAGAAAAPEVTFLYKLTPGGCPKSYGTNVARLAGLPEAVVRRAALLAAAHSSLADEAGGGGEGGGAVGGGAGQGRGAGEAEAAAVAAVAAKVVRAVKTSGGKDSGVLAQLRREAEAALADLDEEEGAAERGGGGGGGAEAA